MKKSFCLAVFFLTCLSLFFISCSDVGGDGNGNSGDGALSYSYLTQNRGFIGGSLIWNPDTGASQLKEGTKIGVRLGKLKTVSVSYKEGAISDSVLAISQSDFEDAEFTTSNANGVYTTTLGTTLKGSKNKTIYQDQPEYAEYGYLSVNGVNADSISLTYTKVDSDNSKSSSSIIIQKGKTYDLNGDGNADLKYDEPKIQRSGYSGARWLTFVNDDNKPYSSMFFTFTTSAARAGYRASTEEAEMVEEGLYGVNNRGDFIYISRSASPSDSAWKGAAHGDYIVCTEPITSDGGECQYNSSDYSTLDPNSDASFYNAQDSYDKDDLVSFTKVEQSDYNACYVVTKNINTANDDDLHIVNRNNFTESSYAIDYNYVLYQFPDTVNGPSMLLKELTDESLAEENVKQKVKAVKKAILEANSKTEDDSLPTKNSEVIAYLNTALTNEAFFNAVVDVCSVNNFVDDVEGEEASTEFCKSEWKKATDDAGKRKFTRIILDEFYDASPDAVIDPPYLENVYPTMYANIGSASQVDQTAFRASNLYTDIIDSDARSLYTSDKWSEFEAKRTKMRNEWKKYKSFSLVGLLGSPYNLKDAGMDIGLGVKGSVSNPSGQFRVDAGFALFVDIDLSPTSVANALMQKNVSASANEKMSKLLETLFKDKKNCDVKKTDIEVQAGPIPLVFGFSFKTGVNVDLGEINPHLCFVGMYGADAYVDLHYGWKKALFIPYPYVNCDFGGKGIAATEMFVGIEKGSGQSNDTIKFEPWVSVIPSAGIGKSAISVRASLPITLGTEFKFKYTSNATNANPITLDGLAITTKVNFVPYADLNLYVFKFRMNICNKPLMNNALVFYKNGQIQTPPLWEKR